MKGQYQMNNKLFGTWLHTVAFLLNILSCKDPAVAKTTERQFVQLCEK